MAVTIYVSRKGQSDKLRLRDSLGNDPGDNNITTKVSPNEEVIWELDNQSGLSEITGIKESDPNDPRYKGSQNLLAAPAKREKNGSWTATILPQSQSPGKDKFQNYMVGYKISGDPKEYWDDPKLLMK